MRTAFVANFRPRRLDMALAAGERPESRPTLAARAGRLTAAPRRLTMARALRRIVREARHGLPRSYWRITPSSRVSVAADELLALAEALARPGPVHPSGAAQVWILLTDGTGPLYDPHSGDSIRKRAAGALASLRARD